MQSIIFKFIDKDLQENVSIGSLQFMDLTKKTSQQLICYLGWEHTEEQREYMCSLPVQELYEMLICALENNADKVFYPN